MAEHEADSAHQWDFIWNILNIHTIAVLWILLFIWNKFCCLFKLFILFDLIIDESW
jgi:hypothetical protein